MADQKRGVGDRENASSMVTAGAKLTPRRGTVAHLGNGVVVFTFTREIYRGGRIHQWFLEPLRHGGRIADILARLCQREVQYQR